MIVGVCGTWLAGAPAAAALLADFEFNEPLGTTLEHATNSASPTSRWSVSENLLPTFTSAGTLRIQKVNDAFAPNYLQIVNVDSGQAWLVAELAGWSLSSLVGPREFDTTQREDLRLGFLNDDTGTHGTATTAAFEFRRRGDGSFVLVGTQSSTQAGENIAEVASLPLNQNTQFTVVLQLDKDRDRYAVYYRSEGEPFHVLGTAPVDPARDGNSLRLAVNNSWGGTGEFISIDRIYVSDTSPVTDVATLTLELDAQTGEATLVNDSDQVFDIDWYQVASTSGGLLTDAWQPLGSRLLDAVDGPDPGTGAGDGAGESWEPLPLSSPFQLGESFTLGSSVFVPGRRESLGPLWEQQTPSEDLRLSFRRTGGSRIDGLVRTTRGGARADFDNDGDIDGGDFLNWQRHLGQQGRLPYSPGDATGDGTVDAVDLAAWETRWGEIGGAANPAAALASLRGPITLPEPESGILLTVVAGAGARTCRPGRRSPQNRHEIPARRGK
jgi:hypothetical protein